MEELDEFELLWPDACHAHPYAEHEPPPPPGSMAPVQPPFESPAPRAKLPKQRCAARSRPVDVPARAAALLRRWEDGEEEENDGDGEIKIIVPPHLLVSAGRRRSEAGEAVAASTLMRSGRPCKRARDLRLLRNSVLRMTGFIEG